MFPAVKAAPLKLTKADGEAIQGPSSNASHLGQRRKVKSYRVGESGWRKFCLQSIAAQMGIEVVTQEEKAGPAIASYCRVSSESQDEQSNLKRQVGRPRKEVAAREGISPRRIVAYTDVASSYGNELGLN